MPELGTEVTVARRAVLKILIVEDHPLFRGILRETLTSRFPSAEVFEAKDLAEARQSLREVEPDLVFLDISLPDGSGMDLLGTIREAHPATTVAICTTHDLPEYRKAAREQGAAHFLCKGRLQRAEICSIVATLIGRGAGQDEPRSLENEK